MSKNTQTSSTTRKKLTAVVSSSYWMLFSGCCLAGFPQLETNSGICLGFGRSSFDEMEIQCFYWVSAAQGLLEAAYSVATGCLGGNEYEVVEEGRRVLERGKLGCEQ
jgi:hypothetical protein